MPSSPDPSLNQSLVSRGSSISQLFDQDRWERHRRVNRYFRHITPASFMSSTVMLRILAPCSALTAVAAAACAYNLAAAPALRLPSLALNMAPLQLLAPIIGLLLVFRTNGSYARFTEGRQLWGSAVRQARDLARLASTHLAPSPRRKLLLGYLHCYLWLLKAHLRSGRTRAKADDPTAYRDDPGPEVARALPAPLAARLLAAPNRPFVALVALSSLLASLEAAGGVPDWVAQRFEATLVEMGSVTGGCERLLSTPMPLSYTRFTGRALMLWLFGLPLGLWPLLGWATVPATFFISYVVIGIDEIGVEIEEPFCILPVHDLSLAAKRDIGLAADYAESLAAAHTEEVGPAVPVGAGWQQGSPALCM